MHPPFGITGRKCTKSYTIPDTDIVIDEGTLVLFSVNGLHTDAKYYNAPRQFKPERHCDAETSGKGFVEMPNLAFGEGPRNCLGMRLAKLSTKVAVVSLLCKFRFELADEHKNSELKLHPLTMVKSPINGINVKVSRR